MSKSTTDHEAETSRNVTLKILDEVLKDFGLDRNNGSSEISLTGSIPVIQEISSEHIHMSLIGAVPSLSNAIVATQIFEARSGHAQTIEIDLQRSHNYLDPNIGMTPTINGQGGIYETADDRHVVPSAVYVDLVYQCCTSLRCTPNPADVAAAILAWRWKEQAAQLAGLSFAAFQSEASWQATEQGKHMSSLPIVPVQNTASAPLTPNSKRPLEGMQVLCLTHAIAGPSCGRTLAEYGASVLQIMYTHGFEHPLVYTYASLSCTSSRLNFNKAGDRSHLWTLIQEADVWVDSYRDGALSKFGCTDEKLHQCNPSLIVSHVQEVLIPWGGSIKKRTENLKHGGAHKYHIESVGKL